MNYLIVTNNIAVHTGHVAHKGEIVTASEIPDIPYWLSIGVVQETSNQPSMGYPIGKP